MYQYLAVSFEQELSYTTTEGDEVEDLAALLAAAKMHFPGLQGVASGAIASDYQRLRVEAVSIQTLLMSQVGLCAAVSEPAAHTQRLLNVSISAKNLDSAAAAAAAALDLGSAMTCAVAWRQVCGRLGLLSLAYLWRQPQARLLRDMWQAGIHAVMVKVAGMGTSPSLLR